MGNKVIAVGLGHTGTRSLNQALIMLGIPAKHWPHDRETYHELANGVYRLSILEKYDAVTDVTLAPFYAQLDQEYPGSKFILTVRDKKEWLERMTDPNAPNRQNRFWISKFRAAVNKEWRRKGRHARNLVDVKFYRTLMDLPHRIHRIEFQRIAAYGLVQRHRPERLSYVYDLHIKNVCEYFQDRPNDLLIMNILQGDGWDVLCPFLGKPAPQSPFPNLGRRTETS